MQRKRAGWRDGRSVSLCDRSAILPGGAGREILDARTPSAGRLRIDIHLGSSQFLITSSVKTLKLTSVLGPNVVAIATSIASRPLAISTRPIQFGAFAQGLELASAILRADQVVRNHGRRFEPNCRLRLFSEGADQCEVVRISDR